MKSRNFRIATQTVAALLLFSTSLGSPTFAADPASLDVIKTIDGAIAPKSVASSDNGLISAHNMMYRHSVTFYDAQSMELVATTPDSVNLKDFGFDEYSGQYKGAPVEGAFSPDGKYLYVTNYAMYGKGFYREGTDICNPQDKYDRSFLYRIDLSTKKIDAIYKVGVVPKVVKVSPDNKYILVSNWCSYDLSVISVEKQKVIKTIYIGAYPRGIAISKDSKQAYVAQMGGSDVHAIDLTNFTKRKLNVGSNPRALVLSPDNNTLYATLNLSGKVIAFDLAQEKVTKGVKTGLATRSLALSTDGAFLYVVNYKSATVSKIKTDDFSVVKTKKICSEPIGITYESTVNRVWVACYKGQIKVLAP